MKDALKTIGTWLFIVFAVCIVLPCMEVYNICKKIKDVFRRSINKLKRKQNGRQNSEQSSRRV